MKRTFFTVVAFAAALPLAAQQQASPVLTTGGSNTQASPQASPMMAKPAATTPTQAAADAQRPVATVNGETITLARLDQLWSRLSQQMRTSYEANGGKAAFLDNYVGKRLVLQEAVKGGFDKRPEVQGDMQSAAEGALFTRYISDVVASNIVTDAEIKKYYDDHTSEFQVPETAKVRHIIIIPNGAGPRPKTKEQALELIKQVSTELHQQNAMPGVDDATRQRLVVAHFVEAARKYSEDGAAPNGGDLGWVAKGSGLDPDFEAAAFKLPIGVLSGIVESTYGYHLILVEGKKAAGVQDFDAVRSQIRENLLAAHSTDIVEAVGRLTRELRGASKVAVYPENIK